MFYLFYKASSILLLTSSSQMSEEDYSAARQLLFEALKIRRKYMSLSQQEFCQTTASMLDERDPPSSEFCVPSTYSGAIKVTPGGDIVSGVFAACTCTPLYFYILCKQCKYMYKYVLIHGTYV